MTIRCEPGALLRDVVSTTLEHGLLPRALTNLLDLTVGGVLSVGGGIGQGSHRHGPLAANVAGLEVVTGDGSIRACSRRSNTELFDAVIGGLGRCGVIVSAELALRPVRSMIRTHYLLYDRVETWIHDQRQLLPNVDAMEGLCSASIQGLRGTGGQRKSFAEWFFPLQVSFEYDSGPPELPAGLSPFRIVHVEDDSMSSFTRRHDMRFEMVDGPYLHPTAPRACTYWRGSATHTGPIEPPGIAPTGRRIEFEGITNPHRFFVLDASTATGLVPDVPGLHGPNAGRDELAKVLIPRADGGILSRKGVVDYTIGKGVAPGVFVVVEATHPRIIERMDDLHVGQGPYYAFHRPYHLTSLEVPLTAARGTQRIPDGQR
jgi:hypothetical protein